MSTTQLDTTTPTQDSGITTVSSTVQATHENAPRSRTTHEIE
jgi:hypothetical protein